MKHFFSSFLATLSALLVFCFGLTVVLFLMIGVLAAMGEKPVTVQRGAYLVLDLNANITDAPAQLEGLEQLSAVFGGRIRQRLQLRELTRAIEAAAHDSDIAGLFIHGMLAPEGYGSGFAALREVREALAAFRQSGKPVRAYLNWATTRELYLASAASELTLDPYGAVLMPGLAAQPMFLTGTFEKLGIGVQVTRVGKYKSAVEPYTRRDLSPENRAQTQQLLDDVWTEIVAAVEQGRGLEAGTVQRAVDAEGFLRAEPAQRLRLVDRTAYWDTVLEDLKAATGRKGRETFTQVALKDYAKLVSGDGLDARRRGAAKVGSGSGRLGIVYAEGEIVDGDGTEEGYVYGAKVARQIRQLRSDDDVKAIVLRVNSPGGSASASEMIQRELQLAKRDKHVVVSMGTVAASGGYWISMSADRIYAEPTTITGSIGVFGMFLNIQGLANDKLGLTFDTVKTGRFADAATIVRPKTDEELALFQGFVDWIYDEFTNKVAQGRGLELATVREIAQGRVWSGTQALRLGLVDELGGLDAAVRHAAEKAGLGERFRVVELPRRKQFAEALAEAFEGGRREETYGGQLGALVRAAREEWRTLQGFNDPRGVYARLPFDLRVN